MQFDLRTICSVLIVAVVLLIADRFFAGPPSLARPARAGGVTGVTEETEVLYTASADGKTIYMWQAYGSKPPKFLGQSDAVL